MNQVLSTYDEHTANVNTVLKGKKKKNLKAISQRQALKKGCLFALLLFNPIQNSRQVLGKKMK